MDQVARRPACRAPWLYVYFKDKTDLMFGIGGAAVVTLRQYFADAVAKHPRGLDQLVAIDTLMSRIFFPGEQPVYFDVMARCEFSSPDTSNLQPTKRQHRRGYGRPSGDAGSLGALGLRDDPYAPTREIEAVTVCLWGFTHGNSQLSSAKATIACARWTATTPVAGTGDVDDDAVFDESRLRRIFLARGLTSV